MTDIATLGIKIDTGGTPTAAAAELDKLTNAGKKAQDSISGVEKAARLGGTANKDYSKALGEAYGVTNDLTKAQVSTIRGLEDQIARTKLSGVALAQYNALRAAGTSADTEAGKAIAALAAQQFNLSHEGEHANDKLSEQRVKFRALAEAAGTANPVLGEMVGRYGQLTIGSQHLTPGIIGSTLAIGGMVAIAVRAVSALKELATAADIAERSGLGIASLSAIGTAGSNSGLDPAKLQSDILAFSHAVDQAREGVGSLYVLLGNSRNAVRDTQEAFLRVAELVKNAGSDAAKFSILQQAGLPATREMAKFMEQGAASLRAQIAVNGPLTEQLREQARAAKEFEDAWNRAWTAITDLGKRALISVVTPFIDSIKEARDVAAGIKTLEKDPFIGPRPLQLTVTKPAPRTVDPAEELAKISKQQQYLALLGQTMTVEQQVRQVTLSVNAAHFQGVDITAQQADNLRRLARENALGVTQIKAATDATNVEIASFGMAAGQAASYAAVQSKINEYKRLGIPLTEENIAAIQREADIMGASVQRLDNMRQASDLVAQGGKDLRTELQNGASAWDAFRKAGANALNSIADKLIDMAAKNLVQQALGGSSGGGLGGLFSSIFGGASGGASSPGVPVTDGLAAVHHTGGIVGQMGMPGRYIHPAYFDDAPRFHTGGMIGSDEVPIIARKGEGVFTQEQMRALAPAGSGGAQEIHFHIDVSGARGNQEIQDMVQSGVAAGIEQWKQSPDFASTSFKAVGTKLGNNRGKWK